MKGILKLRLWHVPCITLKAFLEFLPSIRLHHLCVVRCWKSWQLAGRNPLAFMSSFVAALFLMLTKSLVEWPLQPSRDSGPIVPMF